MIVIILYLFSFIRTLIVFVILYLVIRWFSKFLTPKTNHNAQRNDNRKSSNEGDTTIRFNQKGEKIVDKNKGEYIDFEEVD